MSTPTAGDLLADLREARHRDATAQQAAMHRWLNISALAIPALYTAAAGGNVTCKAAVRAIEALRQKPQPKPTTHAR